MQVAHQEWRENNVAATLALLDGTKPKLRGWEWHYVHQSLPPGPVHPQGAHELREFRVVQCGRDADRHGE